MKFLCILTHRETPHVPIAALANKAVATWAERQVVTEQSRRNVTLALSGFGAQRDLVRPTLIDTATVEFALASDHLAWLEQMGNIINDSRRGK